MSDTTRRAVLAGLAGAAVAAPTITSTALPAAAGHPDAELLALAREIEEFIAAWNADPEITDAETDRNSERLDELDDALAGIEARTLGGVRAKLRRIVAISENHFMSDWEERLMTGALATLDRLIAQGGAS